MRPFLLAIVLAPALSFGATPFLMFDAITDPTVFPVLEKYFQSTDYLGARTEVLTPKLRSVIPTQHQMDLVPSIARIKADIGSGCTLTSTRTKLGIVFYVGDGAPTPPRELAAPVQSIAQAVAAIREAGCQQAGIVPPPDLFGYQEGACSFNLNAGAYRQVNWTQVAFLDLQGEVLVSEPCSGKSGIADYARFASAVTEFVKSRNPRIIMSAHLSFRFTAPAGIIEAVQALSGIVDGFLLSYPLNPALEHKYCTADNLTQVLSSLRPAAVQP